MYFAYPVSTTAVQEAERWSQQRGGPDAVTLPLVTRLAAVQAVSGWLWPHLRTLQGGVLLCRVVRQYVLHDVDLREQAGGLHTTTAEAEVEIEPQERDGDRGVRSEQPLSGSAKGRVGPGWMHVATKTS